MQRRLGGDEYGGRVSADVRGGDEYGGCVSADVEGGDEHEGCVSANIRVKRNTRGQEMIAPSSSMQILECDMNQNMKRR